MLQIQVIGSINSCKSTLAKIISRSLNNLNINTKVIDEEQNQNYDNNDLLKLIKIIEKLGGQPIIIETIQSQRGNYVDKGLSDNQ
jgi:Ni2+-binding GTPase involved in maturation of urease and hydrogenase